MYRLYIINPVCSPCSTLTPLHPPPKYRYTFSYYAISTVFAVLLGILLVEVIRPGRGQPLAGDAALGCVEHPQAPAPAPGPSQSMVNSSVNGGQTGPDMPTGALGALLGVFRSLFPDNLVQAAAQMNILGVIVFSLMFGIALSSLSMVEGVFILMGCLY